MALLKLGNDQEVDVLLPVCKSAVISAKTKIASFFSATKQAKAKDVRFHPKFPYAYDVTKYGSLYTIVERLGPMEEKKKLMNRLREKYESYRHLLPLLLRYMKETLLPLGKVRLAIYFLGNILRSIIPSWQHQARWQLTEVARVALETRSPDLASMFKAMAMDVGGYLLEELLRRPLEENKVRLEYRFKALVKERILCARLRLDALTTADEKVRGRIRNAQQLLGQGWREKLLLDHISTIFSNTSGLISDGLLVYRMSTSGNGKMGAISLATSAFFSLRSYFSTHDPNRYKGYITDDTYRRMHIMARLAEKADSQDQLLGLRSYYLQEYRKAANKIGDVDTKEPNTWEEEFAHPWKTIFYAVLKRLIDPFLYIYFAIDAVYKPQSSTVAAVATLSNLHMVKDSAGRFSNSVFALLDSITAFSKIVQPIEQFYAIQKIQPLLKLRDDPVAYKRATVLSASSDVEELALERFAASSSDVGLADRDIPESDKAPLGGRPAVTKPTKKTQGMKIEFQQVSFTYPNTKKKALDDVSFIIQAGELCSIVGFSGSGKSTIIALMVRLHDPDSGNIYINSIDITRYDPEELYKQISMLFQHTAKLEVSVREFIGMGDTRYISDNERIEEAAEQSGALPIIAKLKHGMDTELGHRHYSHDPMTEDMAVRNAQFFDEWEIQREGRTFDNLTEVEDAVDESTDKDSMDILLAIAARPSRLEDLKAASMEAVLHVLPPSTILEDDLLADRYDASKLDDNDNEESARFSGGEWAKIALARSFLRRDVDLVVLDEFSAALDPVSEAAIFAKFLSGRGEQTIITVTHRFHLACKSDHILFMKGGKLLEEGDHVQLMSNSGEYRKMYECTTSSDGKKEIAIQTE